MATDTIAKPQIGEINKYDFRTESKPVFRARKGLDAQIVAQISEMKNEPAWMRDFRLKSLEIFNSKPMPHWGGNISLDFQDIYYYLKPADRQGKTWDDVPEDLMAVAAIVMQAHLEKLDDEGALPGGSQALTA